MSEHEYTYCPRCGAHLELQRVQHALRPVCPACGWIYYADPKVAAAALVIDHGRILLVRRLNDPCAGKWSFPAGFVDAGEDPARAAQRETLEETGLQVEVGELLELFTGREHSRGADLLLVYHAALTGGEINAGDDALSAAFFSPQELPPLAFESTRRILEKTFKIRL